jgi:hypothetical protein
MLILQTKDILALMNMAIRLLVQVGQVKLLQQVQFKLRYIYYYY